MGFEYPIGEMEALLARKGKKKGNEVFNVLGRTEGFIKIIRKDIGRELLLEIAADLDKLFEKIINEEATEVERADFRALRKIGRRWTEKINAFEAALEEIRK